MINPQLRVIVFFIVTLASAVCLFVMWTWWDFNNRFALNEARYLVQFSERALSRLVVGADDFSANNKKLWVDKISSDTAGIAPTYEKLVERFPLLSSTKTPPFGRISARILTYHGLLTTPGYLVILPLKLNSAQVVYSYHVVDETRAQQQLNARVFERAQPAILIALVSVIALMFFEYYKIHRLNKNITAFADWASQLSSRKEHHPIPNFSSDKFNYMAFAIDKNLTGITDMLQKEQSFAKFTSHELRTSIAVLSANMEVLELMLRDLAPQERKILSNMESAVSDMKYQMEALLWLSKENEGNIVFTDCDLKALVEKAIDDNRYLVNEKAVCIHFHGEHSSIFSNPVFVQIILNNLLRNAYQNTTAGTIDIQLLPQGFIIDNKSTHSITHNQGFGLGLILVEKLVAKLGIQYHTQSHAQGRRTELRF